jgi:two-component system OmpR family sensor kinase/two-component system sensor histidine kinase BaeS
MANSSSLNIQESITAVRRRLWLLLLKAFGLVVLLFLFLTLSTTLIFLSTENRYNPYFTNSLNDLLITYFQGHQNWEGVQTLFDSQSSLGSTFLLNEWQRIILLDKDGRVVVDQGSIESPLVGQIYPGMSEKQTTSLMIKEELIGSIVFEKSMISMPLRFALQSLAPIIPLSFVLGLLTLVTGLLLMRRVVDPLSEVIAAAACVASGDLSTRVALHRRKDDIYALSSSFNRMADSLERSDQQRRSMLADVAHELRTPLSILRGRLEGILDGIYPSDEQHIATALEEVYLLERLVEDLRLLTLAEAHQLPLELIQFDLSSLAEKTITTFSAESDELKITLSFSRPGEMSDRKDWMVTGDPQRIEQVIGNLIGNALRYVPGGGLVTINLSQHSDVIRLIVSDNGPGVPEKELPFVFDRFWRGEKARNRTSGGAGLGLAIARQLVVSMGGEIGARNREGGGFEVWFELPAVK